MPTPPAASRHPMLRIAGAGRLRPSWTHRHEKRGAGFWIIGRKTGWRPRPCRPQARERRPTRGEALVQVFCDRRCAAAPVSRQNQALSHIAAILRHAQPRTLSNIASKCSWLRTARWCLLRDAEAVGEVRRLSRTYGLA